MSCKATFQFTYTSPVSNVTMGAFINHGSNFAFAYAKDVASKALIEFCGFWLSSNDGLIIITQTNNYLIPFNNSVCLKLSNDSVNELQLSVTPANEIAIENLKCDTSITIDNSSPILGIGFYYGAGSLTIKWFFTDGIILQSATADQAYTILTGTSTSTLTQYVSGYTNATGYGQVTITLSDTPYELIDIDWSGVTYRIINISVSQPTTTTTTTAPPEAPPFPPNFQPNSAITTTTVMPISVAHG